MFNTEFIRVINETGPDILAITSKFNAYTALFEQEDIAFKKISKSIYTDDINDGNYARKETFRGMRDAIKAAVRHFREDVKSAAKRLTVLMDTYGNITRRSLNEETAAIINLIQDFKGRFAADVVKVGIGELVKELEGQNIHVSGLVASRYDEEAQKSENVMLQARNKTDKAYKDIIKRIEAMNLIDEQATVFREFICKFNAVIEKYRNILAQRAGIAKAAREKSEL
jgi:hypothetical protein